MALIDTLEGMHETMCADSHMEVWDKLSTPWKLSVGEFRTALDFGIESRKYAAAENPFAPYIHACITGAHTFIT